MERPPILEYRTPQESPERRRRAASGAVNVGIFNVLCVLVLLVPFIGAPHSIRMLWIFPFTYDARVLIWMIMSGVTGICFIIGGAFVRRPNRFWEISLLACIMIQALTLLALIVWVIVKNEGIMPLQLLLYLAQALCLFSPSKNIRQIGRDD